MAVTQNTYTGDGSTVLFSFTFPYLETTDIKVSLNGVNTTAYTLANPTTIQFNTAPTSGAAIRIYRVTDDSQLAAQFYPGSAIRSQDLNENFTQNLYVTQEANNNAAESLTTVNTANQNAAAAVVAANTAISTANQAAADAATAVSTANTASTNAINAVSTANTAASDAADAVTTANSALSAVSDVLSYTTINNVASIPGSPTEGDAIRVVDSTGIESFSPLSGLPAGFVGDSGLTVELFYQNPSWLWTRYYPVDPENRYEQKDPTILKDADVGVSVQPYDANLPAGNTILVDGDVGVTVQAYDADTAKLDIAQSFTAQQTFKELKETTFTLATTGTIALDPANGSIQRSVLTGAPTFTDALEAGQTIVLMLENGASHTVTWPTITWVTSAGNSASTLTAKDTLVLWKVSTTLYGAYVGSYA